MLGLSTQLHRLLGCDALTLFRSVVIYNSLFCHYSPSLLLSGRYIADQYVGRTQNVYFVFAVSLATFC
jgi:hypothetical protein